MDIICFLLATILSYLFLFKPIFVSFEQKRKRKFWSYYRHFQLVTVQKHYPLLDELSLREIGDRYNVTEAYNRLR